MNTNSASRWLKTAEWLAGQLGNKDVAIVDASYYLPTQKRDAKAEYLAAHIPGAVFSTSTQLRTTHGPAAYVARPRPIRRAAGALGISENDTIVIYDGLDFFLRACGGRSGFSVHAMFSFLMAVCRPGNRKGVLPRPAR